ncbi:hypothetical protein [Pseudosporangium ferrugineum]|uniref:Uncharacterized protein n=1 Tax=Pseudosporangium ferrugineum TaxID=439699 RepID=A0A2T0RWW6_9ACTN|nr:hypothetical protein [Pseudosporangium ferrugineum]PRY25650.1 hypothetical protein CLV70_11216 [Pseudosporangium ferrugineum]
MRTLPLAAAAALLVLLSGCGDKQEMPRPVSFEVVSSTTPPPPPSR